MTHNNIGHNGSRLCEVAEIEEQIFNLAQKFNRRTKLEFSTEPPLLPNPCYAFALYFSVILSISLCLKLRLLYTSLVNSVT